MKANYNKENGAYCYFHPKEILVGVCPICLNERLVILAAKQGLKSKKLSPNSSSSTCNKTPRSNNGYYSNCNVRSTPSVSGLPKIFALGSLLHRRGDVRRGDVRRRRRRKPELYDHFVDFADDLDATSTSLEDESFISIKFGDNGVASWEKSTNTRVSKVRLEDCSMTWGGQSLVKDNGKNDISNNNHQCMVEHVKPRMAVLRWRKRIGQLLQVIRWRRTNKGNVGEGGVNNKVEKVKVMSKNEKGWMRTLKMRAKS